MSHKICESLTCHNEINCSENKVVYFSHVGGLSEHIHTLRELIIFPLIYKHVYAKFNVKAPRGILFYGPPGTGKTLMAKALANECSKNSQLKVEFFYSKGPEILDKWVGESEKKLRSIFEKAASARPSIIFFDEIDALAPIRSSFQDHVHSSLVATLLLLMDGLDSVNGIIVIGATNRLNAVDSALRRTGRFDRELYFPLPNRQARLEILQVHVKSWTIKPSLQFLEQLADATSGYCGSDLQALCSNAVLCCLKRNYPAIHDKKKMNVCSKKLEVIEDDFLSAQKTVISASRKFQFYQYRLSEIIKPLLIKQFENIINVLRLTWPHFLDPNFRYENDTERYSGRLVILGNVAQGHKNHLAPALLHHLEHLPVYTIDIQSLYEIASRSIEEILVQKVRQAQQSYPCIIYVPGIDFWWDVTGHSTEALFMSLLYELNAQLPILLVCTSEIEMPAKLSEYFTTKHSLIVKTRNPNVDEREQFFAPLFLEKALTVPITKTMSEHSCPQFKSSSWKKSKLRYSRRLKRLSTRSKSLEILETSLRPLSKYTKPELLKESRMENVTSEGETNDQNKTLDIEKYQPKLMSLFDRTVKQSTANAACGQLELLYDQLERCITPYMSVWDRSSMVEKIENILECYENECCLKREENQLE